MGEKRHRHRRTHTHNEPVRFYEKLMLSDDAE